MAWTIRIGAQGAALATYNSYVDFEFLDPLYDIGVATVILAGIDGNPAPTKGMALRIIWDAGLASEVVRWEGIIAQADKKQQGNVYAIRAFTSESQLHIGQTGSWRNYLAITPHAIIQGAGPPANLLTDSQAVARLPYGTAAGVANKVNAGNPGITHAQFVADSSTLFNNMRRLCMQSQYNALTGLVADAGSTASTLVDAALTQAEDYWVGGIVTVTSGANAGLSRGVTDFNATTDTLTFASAFPNAIAAGDTYNIVIYGLEWTTTMEGGNTSTPTFYLVKRRERAATYTPEVFNIPGDLSNARRGAAQFPGVDAVKIVGAGSGASRVTSATAGTGSRELVIEDKAIFQTINADNMANRVLGIYGVSTEVITATCQKHSSPTRAGDSVTIQQAGVADATLRAVLVHYRLSTKTFTIQFGRPTPVGRDNFQALLGIQRGGNTTPQFTDLIIPGQFDRATPTGTITFGAPGTTNIAGDAQAVGAATVVALDGDVEGALYKFNLVLDAASPAHPGHVFVDFQAEFNNSGAYRTVAFHSFSGNMRPTGAGAQAGTYTSEYSVPFKLYDIATNATNITRMRLTVTNQDAGNIIIDNVLSSVQFWLRPKHRHNEQL